MTAKSKPKAMAPEADPKPVTLSLEEFEQFELL